jgi:hypothetical protein
MAADVYLPEAPRSPPPPCYTLYEYIPLYLLGIHTGTGEGEVSEPVRR